MASKPVIIFGPTGQAGSVAALTASQLGAKVWLAMRDTTKPIPGLSADAEQTGNFSRVQADLSRPDSLTSATKTSSAKRAFIYLLHNSPDHMRTALSTLKTSGVEFIVFLSSFTIETDKPLRSISQTEHIPYIHAQVEANLDEIFGPENYIAVRNGCFASNHLAHRSGIMTGEAKIWGANFLNDNISPEDIGRVMGTILVQGPKNNQKKVYLYGPQILSTRDCVIKIGQVLGREVKVTEKTAEEAYDDFLANGWPAPVAKYAVDVYSGEGRDKGDGLIFPNYEEGSKNVELYTGKPAMTLEEWVQANRAKFEA